MKLTVILMQQIVKRNYGIHSGQERLSAMRGITVRVTNQHCFGPDSCIPSTGVFNCSSITFELRNVKRRGALVYRWSLGRSEDHLSRVQRPQASRPASLKCSRYSNGGTFRASGMAGIEPMPSESGYDWTPLSPQPTMLRGRQGPHAVGNTRMRQQQDCRARGSRPPKQYGNLTCPVLVPTCVKP